MSDVHCVLLEQKKENMKTYDWTGLLFTFLFSSSVIQESKGVKWLCFHFTILMMPILRMCRPLHLTVLHSWLTASWVNYETDEPTITIFHHWSPKHLSLSKQGKDPYQFDVLGNVLNVVVGNFGVRTSLVLFTSPTSSLMNHSRSPLFELEARESDVVFPSSSVQTASSSSRAFLAAQSKARNVTFYRNGKPFEHAVRLAFVVGGTKPTFRNLDTLMDYLTVKCPDIPYGVRYLFTLTGKIILRIDDLQHNQSYVMSGVKQYYFMNYGVTELSLNGTKASESSSSVKSYTCSSKSDPIKPRQPYYHSHDSLARLRHFSNGYGRDFLSDTLGKVITLVNGWNPTVKSRVILNLRTPKSFESVLKDLGESVQLPNPKKLWTESGREVTYDVQKNFISSCSLSCQVEARSIQSIICLATLFLCDLLLFPFCRHELHWFLCWHVLIHAIHVCVCKSSSNLNHSPIEFLNVSPSR